MRGDTDKYDRVAELLADALLAEGPPPCGNATDKTNRCPFWRQCATEQQACHEFVLWANGVTVQENGEYSWKPGSKILRAEPRNPSANMYRKVFVED